MARSKATWFVGLRFDTGELGVLELSEKVISFEFTDSEKKADRLVLTVDNQDLSNFDDPIWAKGNELEFWWGYSDSLKNWPPPTIKAVVQKVTGFQKLRVEANAKSVLMDRFVTSRVFLNSTRSEVAEIIADEYGYDSAHRWIQSTEVTLPFITQARMTDAQFLKRLADREGFEFFVDYIGFRFHTRIVEGGPTALLTWRSSKLGGLDILDGVRVVNDITRKSGKITVKGRDPITKKDIDVSASDKETERGALGLYTATRDKTTGEYGTTGKNVAAEEVRTTPQTSEKSAKREADARYRKTQQAVILLEVPVIGDSSLFAKSLVEIQGISERLSGLYYVSEAVHKIDSSGYTTNLKCRRDGDSTPQVVDKAAAREQAGESKAKVNEGKYQQGDEERLLARPTKDARTGKVRVGYFDTKGRQVN